MPSVLDVNSLHYKTLLTEFNQDFYHQPEYIMVEADLQKGTPYIYYDKIQEIEIIIPLIKRAVPEQVDKKSKYFDVLSPYGYPGILYKDNISLQLWIHILSRFKKFLSDNNCISAFIRLHPYLNNTLFPIDTFIEHAILGKTVSVDLTNDLDLIKRNYSSNHKRNLKKLVGAGFSITEDEWEYLEDWVQMYNETMTRLQANKYYLFSTKYYKELRNSFGEKFKLILVKNKDGEIAAGGIFTFFGETVQYHLGGTKEEFLSDAPTKLMFDYAIKISKDLGFSLLHLGGGLGGSEDSLFKFKSGFGSIYTSFSTLRMIINLDIYNNFTEIRKRELHTEGRTINNNYFPLYRSNIDN